MKGSLVRWCGSVLLSLVPIMGGLAPTVMLSAGRGAIVWASPLATAQSVSKQLLKRGSTGRAVITLQQQLRAVGVYDGPVTGFFGERTEAAVRRFQQAQGLTPDGVAGTRTLTLLRSLAGSDGEEATFEPFQKGAQGERVRELQLRLALLGFLNGQITQNFDNTTQNALVRFQRSRGLAGDGVVNQQTWNSLRSAISVSQIQAMQGRLREAGFYRGAIDGRLSPATQRAVEAAAHLYGVEADDILRGSY